MGCEWSPAPRAGDPTIWEQRLTARLAEIDWREVGSHFTSLLASDNAETPLSAGMCAGFGAGQGDAHQLVNRSVEPAYYLEVGDRSPGDVVRCPDDDLEARREDGRWRSSHEDGTPY